MKTKLTDQTVKEAERLLATRSYDAAHDLAHHRSVYATAQDIAGHVSEPHDPDVLKIACLWHDVLVKDYAEIDHKQATKDTAEYLRDFMRKAGFAENRTTAAYLAVRHHEFDDTPVNVEGRILFDADKLDTLNLSRVRRFVASDAAGDVPKWKLKAYLRGGVAMIKATRSRLHFNRSKQLFDEKLDEFWDNQEIAEYAEKYDVDLDDIKRSLRRKPSLLDKLVGFARR